jgi:hypothetical protein
MGRRRRVQARPPLDKKIRVPHVLSSLDTPESPVIHHPSSVRVASRRVRPATSPHAARAQCTRRVQTLGMLCATSSLLATSTYWIEYSYMWPNAAIMRELMGNSKLEVDSDGIRNCDWAGEGSVCKSQVAPN